MGWFFIVLRNLILNSITIIRA